MPAVFRANARRSAPMRGGGGSPQPASPLLVSRCASGNAPGRRSRTSVLTRAQMVPLKGYDTAPIAPRKLTAAAAASSVKSLNEEGHNTAEGLRGG